MHCVFWDADWCFEQVDWMAFTFSFGSLAGLVSSHEFATPNKEIQWLGSVFTGIIFCVIVSKMTCSLILSMFCVLQMPPIVWKLCLYGPN